MSKKRSSPFPKEKDIIYDSKVLYLNLIDSFLPSIKYNKEEENKIDNANK